MFYYVRGEVAHVGTNFLVIDANSVGYKIHTSLNTLTKCPIGSITTLYTYLQVREDIFDLYGFSTNEELSTFELLISVTGVGPKAALNILSALPPEKLAYAVVTGDAKAITQAQGVGKKLAERILLELKDKIKSDISVGNANDDYQDIIDSNDYISEAINALIVLGYNRVDARKVVLKVKDQAVDLESAIKLALKELLR